MEVCKNGFWDYASKWRNLFPQERKLEWDRNWIKNDYCASCRYCCGRQDSDIPFPMPLLPDQYEKNASHEFYMLDARTAYLARAGCKADGPHGCTLARRDKPLACGLFPIVLINGGLYLYQNCPAVIYAPLIRFMEFARDAAQMLMEFPFEQLLHLTICLSREKIIKSYINLHIALIKNGKKELVYE